MQILGPTPTQTGALHFKELIKRASDTITQSWLEAVRADRSIPSAEDLEEPLLLDAVPLVLDEILRVIEVDDSKIEHERICSAARHGRERAQEHFDVRELVREYQILREHIFLHIHHQAENFARFGMGDAGTISSRIGVALDEAMRETINAFVEEHVLQLRRLSRTDSLTGLFNHRIFYERLKDELNRARRYDSPLSMVLIDLDDFKSVNETKGHQFGDHLLIKSAERMRADLRQTDILCRYGGDEFGIILPETRRQDAVAMMYRLAEDFKELGRVEGAPVGFGMTFGLSTHPEDQGTVRHMVKAADDRLILSKKNKVGILLASRVEASPPSRIESRPRSLVRLPKQIEHRGSAE
jgi:diguanylate cyclase (GGDEF)-like protein